MTDQQPSSESGESRPPASGNGWASYRETGRLVRTQWPKYFVDVLVIILGISISFAVDNYREESGRRASERVYLESLRADFESDILELSAVIDRTQRVIDAAHRLLSRTEIPGAVVDSSFSVDLRTLVDRPNFISKDATFSDLRSSGNMQLIHDIRLKNGLFSYYRQYESLRAVETSEREISNTLVADYLLKHFSLRQIATGSGPVLRDAGSSQIPADAGFGNTISLRLLNRKELLDGYKEELDLARRIKAKLDTLLK